MFQTLMIKTISHLNVEMRTQMISELL